MNSNSMADDKLRRIWRAATADSAPDALPIMEADALAELAQGGIGADQRDAFLAEVGESAFNADLLATMRAISADAQALSVAVSELRDPARASTGVRPLQRRWLALAAGVAAVAFTVTVIRQSTPEALTPPPTQLSTDAVSALTPAPSSANIMTASFDEAGTSDAATEIFQGDFDS